MLSRTIRARGRYRFASMAVPDTALRLRVTAPLSWMVLAAIVIGLAVGALACAATLAGGSGHLVHAQGQPTLLAPSAESHDGHVTADTGAAGEDPLLGPVELGNVTRSESAGPGTQGHPGMACVVVVDLDVAELVTPLVADWFDSPRATPPGECVGDLDPPVPRFS